MAGATNSATAAADPLAELRDIHLPEAVGYWPLAPGWWLLLASVLLLAGLIVWAVRRYRRNAYRRAAVKELNNIYQQYISDLQGSTGPDAGQKYLQQVNRLLKQVYFTHGGSQVAGLSSDLWISELQRVAPGVSIDCFADRLAALYRPELDVSEPDAERIQQELHRWLQQHKRALLTAVPAGEPVNV